MQTRHRTPTIFNLSMVDVLCCALGCVILLWLLNLREAKEETVTAGKTLERLTAAQSLLDETTTQRDRLQRELETERGRLVNLKQEIAHLQAEQTAAEDRLAKLTRAQRTLLQEKTEVSQQSLLLEDRLREKETQAKVALRRIDELQEQLRDAEKRSKQL